MRCVRFLLGLFLLPAFTAAHHGPLDNPGLYDTAAVVELEGEITAVFWRNPHIRYRLSVPGEAGEATTWELEVGPSPAMFFGLGISRDLIEVGDEVTAAGYVSRGRANSLGVTHLLLPNGEEFVDGRREPRWSADRVELVAAAVDAERTAAAEQAADGIFRVWSWIGGGAPNPSPPYHELLTEQGREAMAGYDAARDNPELRCRTGMPVTMFDPPPMVFSQEGTTLTLRLMEYDVERTIYLDEAAAPAPVPSPVGYSLGRWEGETLVVTTTHVAWPVFDGIGTPQSDQIGFVERFAVVESGARLEYTITATDPVMFSAPVVRERAWAWRPETEVLPYDCAVWNE